MAVQTSGRPARIDGRKAGNIFIAAVVWASGVSFTRSALPLPPSTDTLGWLAPWIIAVIIQLALSLAQSNVRAGGLTGGSGAYILLVLVDIAANAVGLLATYGVIVDASAIVAYVTRAATTGAGLWQLVAAGLVGAVVAVLPESLIKDARGG